ncbi:polar amino acid transport system ATP-binding protein [Propionibacteriaceae bacterium ES.041]|uniref:amino acid ABC transporter ATP-binding protein n=1 Tax=Enemella evansiae TaxID=2016499 RepID=UPI000B961067|nr:amino acid ABC transporter ATP-binding protein [Enemella evansiae]OYN98978.1 ectoine/hydroxyectoine ABC transporter ATP-binding protein EhuA [Enemella evansiae]OYO04995.1 ectoine/hydroxyectoine ABC transporter ATP-binding protein EhuA [Enemella evansiae]OYO07456.1 ectoine/hydroxyectoine ABC transporter ATP-binding protein EhuA [Enemella evansiae]PFG67502.1 polar amino acid transport system ATP-binding protein [Propionibacteriaceae bacterium ES.041]
MSVPETNPSAVVVAHDVHKSFGPLEVLRGIDLTVRRGEVIVILGPSGSGKSTFLRCINRLEEMDSGSITVNGTQIGYQRHGDRLVRVSSKVEARQRTSIGMVFQQFNLFPHMTVLENLIEAPVGIHGVRRAEAVQRAGKLLDLVGLGGREKSYPKQLSGGQQQRVAIARALAIQPQLLLFDEPTSALDPELVGEVLGTMRQLAAEGYTMIVVTHEINFAAQAADRVIFMDEGRVLEEGSPDQVLRDPQHERTREFLARFL